MIRAVLDTNLLISYLLTQGETLSRLLDHWEKESFVYLISPAILAELQEVVNRPRLRHTMTADPQALIDLIEAEAELTAGKLSLAGVCRDPKDDMFIACAVEGDAAYIVSGDADLLALGHYQTIHMIRPQQFLRLLDAAEETP